MKKSRFIAVLFVLMLFFVIFASETAFAEVKNAFDGKVYTISENSDGKLYAFDSVGGKNYLVADGKIYRFSVSGNMLESESTDLGKGSMSASFINNRLYLFSDGVGGILMRECELSSLTVRNVRTIDGDYGDIHQITADDFGNVFYTNESSRSRLNISFYMGANTTLNYSDKIKSILVFGGKLFVYAENKLMRYSVGGSSVQLEKEFVTGNVPAVMISAESYIDVSGEFFSLSENKVLYGTGTLPDYESTAGAKSVISFSADGVGGFFGVPASRTIVHCDRDGNLDIRYTVNENIFAVGENGVVTKTGSKLSFYPYNSFSVRNESSEEKDEEKEDEKDFPDTWNIEGGYLFLNVGDSVSSLIKESGASVTFGGKEVTSGSVKTGMIISFSKKSLTICVKGDINNNGTANTEDLNLLEEYLIGKSELEEAAILAGDMNGDGSVDTSDLVLFRNAYLN